MKRIFALLFACVLSAASPALRAQDAATEERLNKLHGLVQDLLDAQAKQQKQIAELGAQLREEQSKPNTSYASQEDLRRLAEKIQEIDKKREADRELILKEIAKLGKTISPPPLSPPKKATTANTDSATGATPETSHKYIIKPGDSYSVIAQAYREQGIKMTAEQIEKANPGINPNRLQVGQEILIPAASQP